MISIRLRQCRVMMQDGPPGRLNSGGPEDRPTSILPITVFLLQDAGGEMLYVRRFD